MYYSQVHVRSSHMNEHFLEQINLISRYTIYIYLHNRVGPHRVRDDRRRGVTPFGIPRGDRPSYPQILVLRFVLLCVNLHTFSGIWDPCLAMSKRICVKPNANITQRRQITCRQIQRTCVCVCVC